MNRIVCITGATSGIGKACAEKFAEAGDHIIITGRRKERLDELKSFLEKNHAAKVLALAFDVQDKDAVYAAITTLQDKWSEVDILINSAGLALGRDHFDEADITDWETMMHTNVDGLLYVSKAIIPLMVKKKQGHIFNLGSVAGDEVYEKGNVYCASKAAVEFISRSMRIDLLQHHIKVTNIKPGAVETEFSMVRFKGDENTASKVYEGFTPLTAHDVADTIFYCASLPENVCINELEITPVQQANGIYFNKKK